jgi:hypothetical protein
MERGGNIAGIPARASEIGMGNWGLMGTDFDFHRISNMIFSSCENDNYRTGAGVHSCGIAEGDETRGRSNRDMGAPVGYGVPPFHPAEKFSEA